MKNLSFILLCMCQMVFLSGQTVAQENQSKSDSKHKIKMYPSLDLLYQVGGNITSDNFVLQSGLGANVQLNFKLEDHVYWGVGTGFESLNDDQLLPLYLDIKGFVKKNKSSFFFDGQLGYAFMWNNHYSEFNNYTYEGGIRFAAGAGYKFPIDDDHMLMFSLNYKQQYSSITYESPSRDYVDRLGFNLLVFKIGFML